MRRRKFITLIGGAAMWPLATRAQQPERTRRIGVLMPYPNQDNPEVQARLKVFLQELRHLGWSTDRNLQVEYRWTSGDTGSSQKAAMKLIEALEGLQMKLSDDFFTGDKVLRKEDHQAFPLEVIFEVKDGKHVITQTIPGEKTLFPPACKFTTA